MKHKEFANIYTKIKKHPEFQIRSKVIIDDQWMERKKRFKLSGLL
jgi:hypothetical protein